MLLRRNGVINPRCSVNNTGYAAANGTGPGVSTNVRMTDGTLVIPETGQIITTYNRITWTTAPTDLVSCGSVYGGPSVDQVIVAGGKVNTLSVYHRTSHADRVENLVITLHDSANNQLILITGPAFATGGSGWVRMSMTFTAPANAVRAYCRIYPKSVGGGTNYVNGDTMDTTGWLVEQTDSVGSYFDGDTAVPDKTQKYLWESTAGASASQLNYLPNVVRKNWCPNPSFEANLTGWTHWVGTGGASNTTKVNDTTAFSGTNYLRETWTTAPTSGGGQFVFVGSDTGPDMGGKKLACSIYVRPSVPLQMYCQLQFFNKGVATGIYLVGTTVLCPANQWTRIGGVSAAAAAGDNKASVRFYVSSASDGAIQIGTTIDFDACLVEIADSLGSYFDGGTAWDNTNKFSWYGAANNTESLAEPLPVGFRRNRIPNPVCSANVNFFGANAGGGVATSTRITGAQSPVGDTAFRGTWTADATGDLGGCYQGSAASRTVLASPGVNTGSMWVRSSKTQRIAMHIYHYDAANSLIGTLIGPPVVLAANTWTRISNTVTSPANTDHVVFAAYTLIGTGFSRWVTGDTFDITGLLLEPNTSTVNPYFDGSTSWDSYKYSWSGVANNSESYAEPLTAGAPARKNKMTNPIGPIGTATTNITPTRGTLAVNGDALRLTINDATVGGLAQRIALTPLITSMPVKPNTMYSVSCDFRTNSAAGGGIQIGFYDITQTIIGSFQTMIMAAALNSSTFVRGSAQAMSPANAAYAVINYGTGVGVRNIGEWYDFRQILVEEGTSNYGPWFDGYTASDATTEYSWAGAPVASESYAIARVSNNGKQSDWYQQLVNAGYGPGSLADMEYKRLVAKAGLTPPVKLSMYDLYSLTGEKPRLVAFRK